MSISLFIEHQNSHLAFYINGDLQFNTADEAIYHEYLVIPAIALSIQRFPKTNLKVLICGGGDGLAARDVLRFSEIEQIDLVDYNPEVVELAKTTFSPYNQGSINHQKLTVYYQEAFNFVSQIPDNYYHTIICDFTYPTSAEETNIYSREWFQQINRVLISGGIITTNGVSPDNRTLGFWCLYQTLLSAQLMAKPLQISIPSFKENGYGNWGFFIASSNPIKQEEITAIVPIEGLQTFTTSQLLKSFEFTKKIAEIRQEIFIHTLTCPQLYYYLLNPFTNFIESQDDLEIINFLEIQELGNNLVGFQDSLQLASIVQNWLEQSDGTKEFLTDQSTLSKLLPIQHRYHNSQMNEEWLYYIEKLLKEINLSKLLQAIIKTNKTLPPKIVNEIKQLVEQINSKQSISKLSPFLIKFMTGLSITLVLANIAHPDAGFAKGYSSSGNNTYSPWPGRFIGSGFVLIGVYSLINILKRSKNR